MHSLIGDCRSVKDKHMKKIGFVILTWNSEQVIGKCLASIAGLESVKPFAVIIDNGSIDGTLKTVSQYKKKFPALFTVLRYRKNMGTTVSRNAGIKRLLDRGFDCICILDSDTVVNDSAFLTLTAELDAHPEYGVIGPKLVTSGGVVQMSARCFPTFLEKLYKACPIEHLQKKGEAMEKQEPPHCGMTSWPVDYLMSACWLVRPDVFQKAGLLDEKIFYAPEDAEFCIRVWKAAYQAAYCPGAEIIHEWQRLSKRKLISRINWEHCKGLLHMFCKHRYLLSAKKLRKQFDKS